MALAVAASPGCGQGDFGYEIVDFRPTVSGVHTVRVVKSRCRRARRLGIAWYRQ